MIDLLRNYEGVIYMGLQGYIGLILKHTAMSQIAAMKIY